HTISGLIQNGSSYLGLFGKTGPFAKLRNLSVVAAAINGSGDYLGILVGYNYGGSISNCSASGAVTGGDDSYDLGGLVGYNYNGTISDCSASGEVNGGTDSFYLGGLVGWNTYGTITNCYASGEVNGGTDSWYLGGLVGISDHCTISDCSASGEVNGGDSSYNLGGLVGYIYFGVISNCYANGAVTGGGNSRWLGGLVGVNDRVNISHCYATGVVTGLSELGGLVGSNQPYSTVSNCYWDKDTTGQPTSSGGGTGKTTAEMKQQATFVGWDFTDTWLIMENQSYPYQHITAGPTPPIPGDNNGDGVVDFRDVAILCGNWLAGTEPEL
ncbi:MAG: GLUG motif-containing protein, partial [Planctomycetota bacterium]